ncbi:TetR-family transcriptional regulator [Acinetobacter pittii PHEA-2]|uniref:TetR-family transcriptional regulator n=1 Tax=Acinetobacter pittii (strain PHEA-2) TaxID=871585 RepID=F0KJI2_ACIP2|nr:TetR/AcrR family transcriptional regulator [Acinetobacter pittii]YP_004994843.1 TetR-family transcriptional regulator [Acinetobacter pittii PHEA-2]ADY81161.1 TetR-family transcriptional regulator [Acinetobacter pittii PHEA-2]
MNVENTSRGRPREFDLDNALDKAMDVFRFQGFHATSISDLSKAMNLTVGSIYKAFGDKHNLFYQVFNRYLLLRKKELNKYLSHANTGYEKIQNLLNFYIDSVKELEGKKGCLVVGSAIEIEVLNHELTKAIEFALNKNLSNIKKLIEEGKADGSINQELNVDQAASLLLCLVLGIRVAGKTSSTRPNDSIISLIMKLFT